MTKYETFPEMYRCKSTGNQIQIVKRSSEHPFGEFELNLKWVFGSERDLMCRRVRDGKYYFYKGNDILTEKQWLEHERTTSDNRRKNNRKHDNQRSQGIVEKAPADYISKPDIPRSDRAAGTFSIAGLIDEAVSKKTTD